MQLVLLIIHLMISVALVIVILLQRSEGGALGIGGGGGGGFMSARGASNLLTRATAWLAAAFLGMSILLAILAGQGKGGASVIDQLPNAGSPPTLEQTLPGEPAPLPDLPAQ